MTTRTSWADRAAMSEERLTRGGQLIGDGFCSSLLASYANMTYNPIALALMIFALACAFAEEANNGPLEVLKARLEIVTETESFYRLAKVLITIVTSLINNKVYFIKLIFVSVPAFIKPSFKNWIITFCFWLFLVFFTNWTIFEILVLGQLWFLFTELRDPKYKILISILAALLIYYAWVSDIANVLKPPAPATHTQRIFQSANAPAPKVAATTPKTP